jgi:hypothetical protein
VFGWDVLLFTPQDVLADAAVLATAADDALQAGEFDRHHEAITG